MYVLILHYYDVYMFMALYLYIAICMYSVVWVDEIV